jgi:aminoglycoside phosphotransferase (APT) family kinase protein
MTDRLNGSERIECRLVVIDAQSMKILTTASTAGPLLPREKIPAYTRVAETLTKSIEDRLGISTIQLAFLSGTEGLSYCVVHELIGPREAASGLLEFTALDDIISTEFAVEERAIVLAIMKGEAKELGRFARLGWIDDLLAKTDGYRGQSSMPIIRQLNQGIDFCLLSMTDLARCKTWFKAVGEPNTREHALTMELAVRFPDRLPRIRQSIPQWNAWVMEDVQGTPLNQSINPGDWHEAVAALASMQQISSNDLSSFYAAGAQDWTCGRLQSLLEPFFADAALAMRMQTSSKVAALTEAELDWLKMSVEVALSDLTTSGIPETILHGDVGHGNVIASPRGPVFLDWAETHVGHPFLCAEHLIADLDRSHRLTPSETRALRLSYAERWRDYAGPDELARVATLAPAIAAFAYAVIAWEAHRSRPEPSLAWPTLRSMLRRTKRELEQPMEVVA